MTQSESPNSLPLLEENRRLKHAVEELSTLNDLARAIGASLNSHDIMQTIIHRSLRAVHAEQGIIMLVDARASSPTKTLVRSMVSSVDHEPFHFNQSLLGWMHLNKKPLVVNDPRRDERFRGVTFDVYIHSLLAVPLMVKSELKGVLAVFNKKEGNPFTDGDQRLLSIIAAQSAQVVENARLYEEERQLLSMQEEVRLAAKIQLDLLPASAPSVAGYDIAGKTVPAQLVGGDYFDFIPVDANRLALSLGDVSGKGLPASLLMANLQATLRAQIFSDTSIKECICRSNRLLYHSTSSDKFVTLFCGLLDSEKHLLHFCNAGHNHPLLFSGASEPRPLKTGGTVLGIMEQFPYEEEAIGIQAGDVLVIYSDGVTEAVNASDEEFGEKKLVNVIEKNRAVSAAELIEKIIAAVRAHTGPTSQADDTTLVVLKRTQQRFDVR